MNPGPEPRNPKPETRNPKPKTQHAQPYTTQTLHHLNPEFNHGIAIQVANGTQQLYIGGRFASACGAASANVAVLVEGYWLPLAEGVAGSSPPPCTLNPAP